VIYFVFLAHRCNFRSFIFDTLWLPYFSCFCVFCCFHHISKQLAQCYSWCSWWLFGQIFFSFSFCTSQLTCDNVELQHQSPNCFCLSCFCFYSDVYCVRMLFRTECEFCSNCNTFHISPCSCLSSNSKVADFVTDTNHEICDTNHVAEFHDLWFVSFVVDFVANFPHAL